MMRVGWVDGLMWGRMRERKARKEERGGGGFLLSAIDASRDPEWLVTRTRLIVMSTIYNRLNRLNSANSVGNRFRRKPTPVRSRVQAGIVHNHHHPLIITHTLATARRRHPCHPTTPTVTAIPASHSSPLSLSPSASAPSPSLGEWFDFTFAA